MANKWRKWMPPTLEYVSNITISFDSLDPTSTGTKEFLFRAMNNKLAKSNNKININYIPIYNKQSPFVHFTYRNGVQQILNTSNKQVNQIVYALTMQNEFMRNKQGLGDENDMENEDEEEEAATSGGAGANKKK